MSLICIVGESSSDEHLRGIPLVKAADRADIDCENAAVIVGKKARLNVKNALGVIVDGESFSGKMTSGVQLITCGISPKNTVSVTSRTDDKLTLSLNRTIRTANGVCEPLELPVTLSENSRSEYDIMAAFAARLLLGNCPQ